MSRPAPFHIFTPQRDKPEELEKILVKRHALLDSAVGKILESVISADKHRLLFVGPRGMGKSYLVTLIHHRLSKQENLAEKMRFAWLNEDQTSTTFLHLLMRIYRRLADLYPTEFPSSGIEAIRGQDPADAREMLGQALIRNLKDRTVVLLIENLDATLDSMAEIEQRTWRGFLQDHPRFAIVATAQGLTKDISSKDKPFFGFFEIHHLEPLTVDEATELLEKIAALNDDQPLAEFIASARGKARMRAIHHLSGGNPRLYLILSDFLTRDSLDNLVRLFEETVDRQLTPYFQERMRWLSPQQQEIVQFLCQQAHPASVKAIAEGIFTKQNIVSSQLKQLREKGYLVAKSRGKESLYELAEPLMRLSFQVKEMSHRQPLSLIVDFIRVWYDRQDLEKRLADIIPGAWERVYFEVALRKIETEGNTFRHDLMLACLEDIDWQQGDARRVEELRGIAEETNSPKAWFAYAWACQRNEKFEEGVLAATCGIALEPFDSTIKFGLFTCRGACHFRCFRWPEAISDFTNALNIDKIPESAYLAVAYGRAHARYFKGEYEGAMDDANLALNDITNREKVLMLRADCLLKLGRCDDGIAEFDKALAYRGEQAEILTKRATALWHAGRRLEARADYDKIIALPDVPIHQLVPALIMAALAKMAESDFIAAKNYLDRACGMEACPDDWLANAHYARGSMHFCLNQFTGATVDLIMAADLHPEVAPDALFLLSNLQLKSRQYEEALDTLVRVFSYTNSPQRAESTAEVRMGSILTESTFGLRDDPEKWTAKVKELLPLFLERGLASELSTSLVRTLETLKNSGLNYSTMDAWVSHWEKLAGDCPQIQVGLRLLRAGVQWLNSEDEGALLDLVKEERMIVRQALGLGAESDE